MKTEHAQTSTFTRAVWLWSGQLTILAQPDKRYSCSYVSQLTVGVIFNTLLQVKAF